MSIKTRELRSQDETFVHADMFPRTTLNQAKKNILYISWAESCSRSDHTARELGGKSKMVYLGWLGSHPLTIVFKYLGQMIMTFWLLASRRPTAVFVMSPPVIAAVPVFIYHVLTRRPFVIDSHTAAFMHPRWRRLQWLQYYLGRQAATNIVTNNHLACLVRENGGRATIVRDVPVIFDRLKPFTVRDGYSVAVVCSFNPDEPIGEILEAARMLPEINFYMTGNVKFLSREISQRKPENVELTGFISDEAYGSLICQVNVVMSLTNRDHTMLRGAWEAIYQLTPVIVSDWPCLREAFPSGALFTDNSADNIASAVIESRQQQSFLKGEAEKARQSRLEIWQGTRSQLLSAVGIE